MLGSQWGSSKKFAPCLSSENRAEELEVGSSVLEGRLLGGTWHYYKFRMKDLNVSFDAEFHQYLPQFEDLLSPNRSSASCSTVGGVNGSAIALVRVGELPSLMTHDSSSCNRCRSLGQPPCMSASLRPCLQCSRRRSLHHRHDCPLRKVQVAV